MVWKKIKKNYNQIKRRWSWALYREKGILDTNILDLIKERLAKGEVKFHFCCGGQKLPGYINADVVPLEGCDTTVEIPYGLNIIPSNVAAEIMIRNGFEHFYRYDQDPFLKEAFRILKPGGKLALMLLPDFDLLVDAYLNKKPGNFSEVFDLYEVYRHTHGDPDRENSPHQLHKDILTKDSVRQMVEKAGFEIDIMENHVDPKREKTIVTFDLVAVKKVLSPVEA